jgi:tetratricopeptide (TPR) repeat protein
MLGLIAMQTGNVPRAISLFNECVARNPNSAEIYFNLGNALNAGNQTKTAIASYDKAIALKPDYAEAYLNRGNACMKLKLLTEAIASFDKAIGCKPDYVYAYVNRGNALNALGQLEEAVANYDYAIVLNPRHADTYVNRGNVLNNLNRPEAAIASFDQAISLQPNLVEAHWNKALALLVSGDLEHGLPLYEWRWKIAAFASGKKAVSQPCWRGDEPLTGKTILLYSEQGFGDAIQFCRYARLVAERGARVILEVQAPLTRLFRDLDGVDSVIARGDPLPPFDYHCPLLSLPLAFNTRIKTVPARERYIRSNPDICARWAERLGKADRPRVGLVWSGSATHHNDYNRSLELATLLQDLPDHCQYVSLQKELRARDAETLQAHPQVLHFGDELNDFADTAALCEHMDLIISVDTSVAHLAGALGKQTWVLLPFSPDWRWLLGRGDSPWYPTMTLYRQTAIGDWQTICKQLGRDLSLTGAERSHNERLE